MDSNLLDPEKIISQIEINPGDIVADLGCGPGYFTVPIAQIVGENGKVYAIDILEDKLEALNSLARTKQLYNIETIRADVENKAMLSEIFPSNLLFDLIVLSNVLFQNKSKDDIIEKTAELLKPEGQLLIIDWAVDKKELLYAPQKELLVDFKNLNLICEQNDLHLLKEVETGKTHRSLVYQKTKVNK
jgi:ubiquinone/menaquinone biosynthesis C-methylase UbiE